MWGVRDKQSINSYGKNILNGRKAIPKVLKLFEQYDINATWAIVGLIFAKNKEEMLEYTPNILPNYLDKSLSPYTATIHNIGNNEKEDPWHYGRSLIDLIKNTPGQEIASHTYSHYYCQENGQSIEAFKADMLSAKAIAKNTGINIKSIVFPRNQMTTEHIDSCIELGISGYRGNPETFPYRSRQAKDETLFVRGIRLIDSMLPIDGNHSYKIEKQDSKLQNIPASRMLRPIQTGSKQIISNLQLKRIKSEMTSAAMTGHMYHLWWHPHNFGNNQETNLGNLQLILQHYHYLQHQYGMNSQNMAYFANN